MSITHYKEHEVAKQLALTLDHHVPGWAHSDISVRFAKTGSDTASMAVRIARAVTERNVILSFGYHGWHSEFIAGEEPAHGIPKEYKSNIVHFDFNEDLDSLEKKFMANDIAAVILEHPPLQPLPGWYYGLRRLCDKYGALLIMDEVVTGLRYGIGGASEKYIVFPDMICLGKSLGNGMPIAALVGFKKYM
jgi:glutamate-1-semialdehyde aminotransferase